jgi:hypothetical protein
VKFSHAFLAETIDGDTLEIHHLDIRCGEARLHDVRKTAPVLGRRWTAERDCACCDNNRELSIGLDLRQIANESPQHGACDFGLVIAP